MAPTQHWEHGSLSINGQTVVPCVFTARSLWARMRGLLSYDNLADGEGLLIAPCRAIHTLGMRFTIDAVFLDKKWRIIHCEKAIEPGRWMVWGGIKAHSVLELGHGWLDLDKLEGQRFELEI